MPKIELKAKTARQARREISQRWPTQAVNYIGYDAHGEAVLMSLVREQGNNAYVATAHRNRSLPPVRFVATDVG
jgi:hypothetical protein